MGIFAVTVGVGNPSGGGLAHVLADVDTGAHHTMLPESLLERLRINPRLELPYRFADGYRRVMGVGEARIAIEDKEMICPVIFGPEDQYLLGATTLEIFSLAADPVNRELTPVEFKARPF